MNAHRTVALAAMGALTLAAHALAQHAGSMYRVETDARGARMVRQQQPIPDSDVGFGARGLLWTYTNDFAAISQSVSIAPTTGLLWVGQSLNGQRLQNFLVPGDGVPNDEFEVHSGSPVAVWASRATDRVAIIDGVEYSGPFNVRGFTAAGPTWEYQLDEAYTIYYSWRQIKVSRDGSTVAVGGNYYDPNTQTTTSRAWFLNAADGSLRSMWEHSGGLTAVDLSDDGHWALVTNDAVGRLVNTADGTSNFSASASGAGGWFVISGDGNTIAVGGFNMQVWRKNAQNQWSRTINFTAPTSWFGWGLAISRDGNTVGCLSHDYGANYLNTSVRCWDVPSRTLLGTVNTVGSGGFQDSASGASMSDDGSLFAVCSWGLEGNDHPEVRIFDRTVHEVGSIDTPGSPWNVSMGNDGRFTAAGGKAVHANQFGNGGYVSLFDYRPCGADFNDDGFVDFFDFTAFVDCFEGLECPPGKTADFNNDGFPDFFDFAAFVDAFEVGC